MKQAYRNQLVKKIQILIKSKRKIYTILQKFAYIFNYNTMHSIFQKKIKEKNINTKQKNKKINKQKTSIQNIIKQEKINKMIAWYGTETSPNSLERLLEKNPVKLELMLEESQFIPELRKFNPRLLQYITNNPDLVKQAIDYIIIAPKQTDNDLRKYKYPLLSVQMIETEALCVINNFFKETNLPDHKYFIDYLFDILDQEQILVISAGYFFRVCQCLLNLKYKEFIYYIYSHPELFSKLLKHSYNISVTNTIQLFLNLQAAKADKIYEQRKKVKVETVISIIKKIDENRDNIQNDTILNLCNIIFEIIEKYYMLVDGKQLLQPILNDSTVSFWFSLLDHTNPVITIPITNIITCLINYYSYSSLNNEDKVNEEFNKRNQERLEAQPLINHLNLNFEKIIIKIINDSTTFNYVNFKLLEMLCHCVSVSCNSFFVTMRKIKFFAILIDFLFKFQNANILHNLIEKTFQYIFAADKKIYDLYKQHIFCELDIIGRTVKPILNQNLTLTILKSKSNFGHLIRIIKIYSGQQGPNTIIMNENIIKYIKQYTELWNRLFIEIFKPYDEISMKELGTYEYQSNQQQTPIQYKVKQISSIVMPPKKVVIQDVDSQGKFFNSTPFTNSPHTNQHPQQIKAIMSTDNFFKLPTQNQPQPLKPIKQQPTKTKRITPIVLPQQYKIPSQQKTIQKPQPVMIPSPVAKKSGGITIHITYRNNPSSFLDNSNKNIINNQNIIIPNNANNVTNYINNNANNNNTPIINNNNNNNITNLNNNIITNNNNNNNITNNNNNDNNHNNNNVITSNNQNEQNINNNGNNKQLIQQKQQQQQNNKNNRINNFSQFLQKKKEQASETIKFKKSTSQEKKIGNKMASPSPRKRDKWADSIQQNNTKQKISLKKEKEKVKQEAQKPQRPIPIPPSKKQAVSQSVIFPQKPKTQQQQLMTRSLLDLNDLKNVKVKFIPKKHDLNKKCRKVQQKDLPFLNFLGIIISK